MRAACFAALRLVAVSSSFAACGTGESGTDVATECVKNDLIAQCPPGSDPRLDAQAESKCKAAGSVNLVTESGSVTGSCVGTGSCKVLCQFAVPCTCGVEQITSEGVFCKDCNAQASCGDGMCTGGEDATSCPGDCGMICKPDAERCNGTRRQVCNLNGTAWDTLDCLENEACKEQNGVTVCERVGL